MKKTVLIAAFAAMVMSFASCSCKIDISGKWNVTSIDSEVVTVKEGEPVPFMEFDAVNMKMHGNTGVNIVNGVYTLDGKDLKIEIGMMTMMAGPEESMAAEQKYLQVAGTVRKAKISGDVLTLYNEEGKAVMTLKK